MSFFLVPYKYASEGANKLLEELNKLGRWRFPRRRGSSIRPSQDHRFVYWGKTGSVWERFGRTYNNPQSVTDAINKINCLRILQQANVSVPSFTTSREEALRMFDSRTAKVVCRTVVDGHEGAGIVIATTPAELVAAPLYTKYIPKRREFRVHVVNGNVIEVSMKVLRSGTHNPTFLIRNTANGFVFQKNNVREVDGLRELAISAVRALGLDFGAVDIIWNEHENRLYVLEINTAPGIEGSTVAKYAAAINAMVRS